MKYSRRAFIGKTGSAGLAAAALPLLGGNEWNGIKAEVVNPYAQVPVSLIIDDSTCLVNMAHFGIPQFAEVFPDRYKQEWRKLPREIPDSFVREFAEWSSENGVKGKYSIVPYPACTGWINRFIPGWTRQELADSLKLVREVIAPNWDIHPEMVSHTRVIDIKTGRPYPDATPEFMENWEWSQNKSADELAAYQAYALSLLRDAGLPCEGITTPGGYGSRNQENLAISTLQAVRDVYKAEIPHYFRDLYTEKGVSVAPRVLFPSGLDGPDPACVVSILGCTGDWFGGWDGLEEGDVNKFISADLSSGRMVEVIDSGEPAIMVCHWPGIYFNGEKRGFTILKEIRKRLGLKYSNIRWMKLSEIARYWAARELTDISPENGKIVLKAPFSAEGFTLKVTGQRIRNVLLSGPGEEKVALKSVKTLSELRDNTWCSDNITAHICISLKKGVSVIQF